MTNLLLRIIVEVSDQFITIMLQAEIMLCDAG